jgi:hypothetical protein
MSLNMRILGECDHKIKKILDWSLGEQDVQVCVDKQGKNLQLPKTMLKEQGM